MSNNQNWNKMGEDIKDALSEALRRLYKPE
jgi:hypothetical protein